MWNLMLCGFVLENIFTSCWTNSYICKSPNSQGPAANADWKLNLRRALKRESQINELVEKKEFSFLLNPDN